MKYGRALVLGTAAIVAGLLVMLSDTKAVQGAGKKKEKPAQIVWTDFKTGMQASKKLKKPTMIHFTTSWCGWCRKLEADVYTQPEIIELAQNFICIKVDGDKEKEVVTYYKVTGYPTILFTNHKREEVHRIRGYMPADGFKAQMEAAVEKSKVEDDDTKTDDKKADD